MDFGNTMKIESFARILILVIYLTGISLTGNCQLNFCGEPIPINSTHVYNQFASLNKKLGGKGNLLKLRMAAYKTFGTIEPILKMYGIPDDYKYLLLVESAGNPYGLSTAGAYGWWQLMPCVLKDFKMPTSINGVDIRTDLVLSTNIVCKYLIWLYNKFHNWSLVAASYNFGLGNIMKTIKKQGTSNYYYMQLNSETGTYVYKIVLYKYLLQNSLYGLKFPVLNAPVRYANQTQNINAESIIIKAVPILKSNNIDSVVKVMEVEKQEVFKTIFNSIETKSETREQGFNDEKTIVSRGENIIVSAMEDKKLRNGDCVQFIINKNNNTGYNIGDIISGCYVVDTTKKNCYLEAKYKGNTIGLFEIDQLYEIPEKSYFIIGEGFNFKVKIEQY